MMTLMVFGGWGIFCGAIGYWLAWSRAEHPGKVAGEASSAWAKIKKALHR
jgi:hypothetical protein